jgi:hypothetical protein
MADTKISALADIVALAAGDKVPVADASDLTVSKSATMTQINTYLRTLPISSAEITALPAAAAVAGTNTFPVDQAGTAGEATVTQLNTYLQTLALASAQITALPAASALAAADTFPVDQSATAGEATLTQLLTFLQNNGMPRVLKLSARYTNATTTGTEVTGLSFNTLDAGTYFVRWALLYEAAATTSSIKFAVNVTNTVTEFVANAYFPSAGVTAATGTMHNAANATTGQVWAYANTITEQTTAPNLGPWVGTTNANVPHLLIVEALVVMTAGPGDIELWCASEVAAQISLEAGSSGICYRTA